MVSAVTPTCPPPNVYCFERNTRSAVANAPTKFPRRRAPVTERLTLLDASARPRHDDEELFPVGELPPGDDHEDQAEGERKPDEQPEDAVAGRRRRRSPRSSRKPLPAR